MKNIFQAFIFHLCFTEKNTSGLSVYLKMCVLVNELVKLTDKALEANKKRQI